MYGDPVVYAAEIQGYNPDPAVLAVQTIYRATYGFTTKPSDTPGSVTFLAGLKQPSATQRDLFDQGTTLGHSRVGFGDVILANDDGQEDTLLNWGFDGRATTIRRATMVNGVLPAYPGGWDTVLVATNEQPEPSLSTLAFKLRDNQFLVDIPAQQTRYLGTGGLEGAVADLLGKVKPLTFGAPVNVLPVLVNTTKQIGQVNDGAVVSIGTVRDKGLALLQGRAWNSGNGGALLTGNAWPIWGSAYGAGLFVVISKDNTGASNVYSSPDGNTWTARLVTAGVTQGLAFGNGIFVLTTDTNVYTSTNGTAWTNRGAIGTGSDGSVAWVQASGLWARVGVAGFTRTSPDGITWTNRPNTITEDFAHALSDGTLLVGTTFQGSIYSSNDAGVTWTLRSPTNANGVFYRIAYGGGLWCASGVAIATSVDGINWIRRPHPDTVSAAGAATKCVAYVGGVFFVSGRSAGYDVYSSLDGGATWTKVTIPSSTYSALNAPHIFETNGTQLIVGATDGSMGYTSFKTYASTTELQDDTLAPNAGEVTVCPSAGMFRLGTKAAGIVTADVTEGTTAADRTAAQIFKRLLIARGGVSSGNINAADLTALDALNSTVLGLYQNADIALTDLLDLVAGSVGAWWGVDYTGAFRIQRFDAPSGSPVLALTKDSVQGLELVTANDPNRGLPVWRAIVRYARNYTVLNGTDLAGAVTQANAAVFGQEWGVTKAEDAAVKTTHLLATEMTVDTLLTTKAAADTEAARILALRKVRRDRIQFRVPFDSSTAALDLGVVFNLTYNRFGYDAGKLFRVIGLEPDASARTMLTTAWG